MQTPRNEQLARETPDARDLQETSGSFHAERGYWRARYDKEGYYEAGRSYEDYDGAYRIGHEGRGRHPGRGFDEVENDLKAEWEAAKGKSALAWARARQAVRAAWDRAARIRPGDDGDAGR